MIEASKKNLGEENSTERQRDRRFQKMGTKIKNLRVHLMKSRPTEMVRILKSFSFFVQWCEEGKKSLVKKVKKSRAILGKMWNEAIISCTVDEKGNDLL